MYPDADGFRGLHQDGALQVERRRRPEGEVRGGEPVGKENEGVPFAEERRPPAEPADARLVKGSGYRLGGPDVAGGCPIGLDAVSLQDLRVAQIRDPRPDARRERNLDERERLAELDQMARTNRASPVALDLLGHRMIARLGEVQASPGKIEAAAPLNSRDMAG